MNIQPLFSELPSHSSIHPSVRPSVHPSIQPSIHPAINPSCCLGRDWGGGCPFLPRSPDYDNGMKGEADALSLGGMRACWAWSCEDVATCESFPCNLRNSWGSPAKPCVGSLAGDHFLEPSRQTIPPKKSASLIKVARCL